jgi:hypothetical protein
VTRFRRTAHLTVRLGESRVLDVAALLRGRVDVRPETGLRVRSLLLEGEAALTLDDLRVLLDVPESEWTERNEGSATLDGLARRGLVVSDADDPFLR